MQDFLKSCHGYSKFTKIRKPDDAIIIKGTESIKSNLPIATSSIKYFEKVILTLSYNKMCSRCIWPHYLQVKSVRIKSIILPRASGERSKSKPASYSWTTPPDLAVGNTGQDYCMCAGCLRTWGSGVTNEKLLSVCTYFFNTVISWNVRISLEEDVVRRAKN